MGQRAFESCTILMDVYFLGEPPVADSGAGIFTDANYVTVYYLPGTHWGPFFGGRPTAPWVLPQPVILTTDTAFGVHDDLFRFRISWATNAVVVIEAATDLEGSTWSPIATNTLVDGWSDFTDSQPNAYQNQLFRIRSP